MIGKYRCILIILVLSFIFVACANDDDFSTDGNLQLSFSSDTISFDTVFTTVGSATKQFKIYNRNKNSLVIQSIELMNPEKSGFRMNIDGEKGGRLSNVEILKKDSLFGFIEVTVDIQNKTNPVLIRDSIRFLTNGNEQFIQLEAIGQDVYIWQGERVTKDSVITNVKPLLVYDSIVVNPSKTLTIEEGVVFYMKKDASLRVHGTLKAKGTIEAPIIFRTSRFDNIEGNIPYNNAPGQWDGVYFYSDSYNNLLENVQVRSATKGLTFFSSGVQLKKADLINSVVHNTSEYGIKTSGNRIDAYNCLFTNSKGYLLALYGGEYTFLHCTIANYYRWAGRAKESVKLSNKTEGIVGLDKCDFVNSIVYGSVTKELILEKEISTSFNYSFHNCLLKADETGDFNFSNIIWNQSPMFQNLNIDGTFSYNFELQKESPAIDKADRDYSTALPYDLKGSSRLNDINPDIGCYEYIGR